MSLRFNGDFQATHARIGYAGLKISPARYDIRLNSPAVDAIRSDKIRSWTKSEVLRSIRGWNVNPCLGRKTLDLDLFHTIWVFFVTGKSRGMKDLMESWRKIQGINRMRRVETLYQFTKRIQRWSARLLRESKEIAEGHDVLTEFYLAEKVQKFMGISLTDLTIGGTI